MCAKKGASRAPLSPDIAIIRELAWTVKLVYWYIPECAHEDNFTVSDKGAYSVAGRRHHAAVPVEPPAHARLDYRHAGEARRHLHFHRAQVHMLDCPRHLQVRIIASSFFGCANMSCDYGSDYFPKLGFCACELPPFLCVMVD